MADSLHYNSFNDSQYRYNIEWIMFTMNEDTEIYELQADVCLALANPKRIQIINLLKSGELSVGEMTKAMGINKANLSQHLTILRQKGIVRTRREGTVIYYRIGNAKIIDACAIMRDVLTEALKNQERTAQDVLKG